MQGMKILVSENNSEWKRVGTAIKYYKIAMNNGQNTYAL